MKTLTSILVFLITYFMSTLVVYILTFDVLSWHTIARHPLMLFIGSFASIAITVAYMLEKEQED